MENNDTPLEFSPEDISALPDDFANDKEIQRQRKIQQEYNKMIETSLQIISDQLHLTPASHKNMKPFLMFKTLGTPILTRSFKPANDDYPLQVSLVEYHLSYTTPRAHNAGTDLYLFGLLALRKSYPLTYIFEETIRERIVNWFIKGDVDFKEQKKFSRRFHVVTKDKEKLSLLLLNKLLDDLAAFPKMEIEINGNNCLFRVSKLPVSESEAEKFVRLAKVIRNTFG